MMMPKRENLRRLVKAKQKVQRASNMIKAPGRLEDRSAFNLYKYITILEEAKHVLNLVQVDLLEARRIAMKREHTEREAALADLSTNQKETEQ